VEEELHALRARVAELERAAARDRDAQLDQAREHAIYRAAIHGAPLGLGIVDDDGDFIVWNDAMLAVSGFAANELELWHQTRALEANRAIRRRVLDEARQHGGLTAIDVRYARRDGAMVDAVVTIRPVSFGAERYWHITMQDVTEHRRVEQALRESELRFRQVAETVHQVLYLVTADFEEVLYVSPSYEEVWGRSCQSLYDDAKSWLDGVHPDDRPRVVEVLNRPAVERQRVKEYRVLRDDGSVRIVCDRHYELLDASGQVYRIVGVADDVTERRRLEEQLRDAQKMEAVGQLAGGVAHDFNNLLTVITGNVSLLLRRSDLSATHREQLEEVERAALRGGELTKKLLGFSRRAPLSLEPIDLRAVARETAALLRRTLDPRVRLVVEEGSEPCTVLADAGEMSQVLLNLCLNGRDAMPEGGRLLIRTRTREVSDEHARMVIDARPGEAVCVTVEDTGHGIASEIRGRVFEPFFTTKEPGAGTGLGLAMVFGIVKQHQGWIELASDPAHGSRFDIYLPRHVTPGQSESVAALATPPSNARETVLFVDDEEAVRKLARAILSDHGYRVLLAEDGPSALALFEREWRAIDLVVLDLRMPRLSGRDTLHRLWVIDPGARVIISSGHAGEHERVAESEPIAGSLAKPYGFEELVRAVRDALERE
jgi:two-component system cell cycle sensor histidine kinase/response regulator CckA